MSKTPANFDDVGLVIAAAGDSLRFGSGHSKLLHSLGGQPVIAHTVARFAPLFPAGHVVIMINLVQEVSMATCLNDLGITANWRLLPGGSTRQQSVYKGLLALPPSVSYVVVQDGARALSSVELLKQCLASARQHGSGVAASKVTDTIKMATAEGKVISTPARERLWAAETPQVFRRDLLQEAYCLVEQQGMTVTDDAQAVELAGKPVYLVENRQSNPKVTYPDDLQRSETLLSR